jgi:hypothetical protein
MAEEIAMLKKIVILLFTFLLVAACSEEARKEFGKLFELRNSIVKEMQVEDVRIMINNGDTIGVSYINTKYNDESETVQEDIRQKTLQLISSYFPPESDIKRAQVSFVIHKRKFLIVNYTNSLNSVMYERKEDGTWKRW